MSVTSNLSPGESKLLHAVIDATRRGVTPGTFIVRMEGYGFHLDLDGYSKDIVDVAEKNQFEASLKSLCVKGLLKRTVSSATTAQQWEYGLTGAALEEARQPE